MTKINVPKKHIVIAVIIVITVIAVITVIVVITLIAVIVVITAIVIIAVIAVIIAIAIVISLRCYCHHRCHRHHCHHRCHHRPYNMSVFDQYIVNVNIDYTAFIFNIIATNNVVILTLVFLSGRWHFLHEYKRCCRD